MDKLTPVPQDLSDPRAVDWFNKLRGVVNGLLDGQTTVVASTSGLTPTQIADLTDSGDSSLHYHSSDRSRANHTGSQLSNTISDFTGAVQSIVTATSSTATFDPIAAMVFGG